LSGPSSLSPQTAVTCPRRGDPTSATVASIPPHIDPRHASAEESGDRSTRIEPPRTSGVLERRPPMGLHPVPNPFTCLHLRSGLIHRAPCGAPNTGRTTVGGQPPIRGVLQGVDQRFRVQTTLRPCA